ncbi:MAG TPA: hypothetical protein VKB76_03205 [Ktedonobacterales bacterium]|nr:hypothetical protein [Ktedonobacterales bacterium]
MKLHKLKRIAILVAPLLLYGGAALAATSGTSIDQPITFFGNLIHGPIANLAFLGGSAAAIYSYHHDGFSRGFLSAAGAMVSGAYLGGIQNIGTLVGLTGALIHVIH